MPRKPFETSTMYIFERGGSRQKNGRFDFCSTPNNTSSAVVCIWPSTFFQPSTVCKLEHTKYETPQVWRLCHPTRCKPEKIARQKNINACAAQCFYPKIITLPHTRNFHFFIFLFGCKASGSEKKKRDGLPPFPDQINHKMTFTEDNK